eukprot:8416236-Pyramimonas_sp.AAC.1
MGSSRASGLIFSLGENVEEISNPEKGGRPDDSPLAACLRMLRDDTNQFAFAVLLDPRMFGTPVTRRRIWIPAVSYKVMQDIGMSESDFYDWVTRLLDRFAGHKLHGVGSLLLDDSDPYVKAIEA